MSWEHETPLYTYILSLLAETMQERKEKGSIGCIMHDESQKLDPMRTNKGIDFTLWVGRVKWADVANGILSL